MDLKNTSGATIAAKNIVKNLGVTATLKPSKNAEIAAKKITEKYKGMRNNKKC